MSHLDFGVVMILEAIFAATANLLTYCFFGKMATESYERMSECLYECNWVNLSPKLQKYIVIIITNAQRPIYYDGFGVAVLNLETFNKVELGNILENKNTFSFLLSQFD